MVIYFLWDNFFYLSFLQAGIITNGTGQQYKLYNTFEGLELLAMGYIDLCLNLQWGPKDTAIFANNIRDLFLTPTVREKIIQVTLLGSRLAHGTFETEPNAQDDLTSNNSIGRSPESG